MEGVVKKKLDGKNFGFIENADGSGDVFFHASALVGVSFDEIQEGDQVTFDVEDTDRGKAAANVQKA
jgi:cold shock protein